MKKSTVFLGFLMLPLSVFMVVPDGYGQALERHPKGSDEITGYWCFDCHEFENDPPNAKWVKTQIDLRPPKSGTVTVDYPVEGAFVKDAPPYNGPCQVCHTETDHYRNDGSRFDHFIGLNCVACHSHFQVNMFTWSYVGGQSHETHLGPETSPPDPKGPAIEACTDCHASDFSGFGPGGDSLEDTTVCDDCHSPSGAFNGSAEGKAKWEDGVYKQNGYELKDGNENWCATCHDDGTSIVHGVTAPNVMGDNATYGYNAGGHGDYAVLCGDCHDLTLRHTDGVARTYAAASNNYKEGYRLNRNMAVPRDGEMHPEAFRLCTSCHNYGDIIGTAPILTGFREGDVRNYHQWHVEWWPSLIGNGHWDSDWNGTLDSAMSCTACHNVHGSPMDVGGTYFPNPVMIRHGELIGHVPALDFHWRKADEITPTHLFEESACGDMVVSPDLSDSHVCKACHYGFPEGLNYCRSPATVAIESVWTSNLSGGIQTAFEPGEDIKYNVRFRIMGSGSFYTKAYRAKAKNTSGTDWQTNLRRKKTLSAGLHEWRWKKTIPDTADPGSGAKVVMQIRIFSDAGGTLLGKDKKSSTFSIVAP